MHKSIIKDATDSELRDYITDALSMLKETNKDVYDELELILYKKVYGCHFNAWLLEKAMSEMKNEDGTKGKHWSLEDTNNVAKQYSIDFVKYNEYDWCYVMNMIYSDYYGSVPNDLSVYVKMAKKFLEDKDASEGKALKYYLAMVK
jgi:hypothetical protein